MEIYNETRFCEDDQEFIERAFLLVPGCCEESTKACRPYLRLNFGEDNGKPLDLESAVPEWHVPGHEHGFIYKLSGNDTSAYSKTIIPVKYCPFCGNVLPKVRRKADPPSVYTDEDGGYYCGTCGERNMSCSCLPMEALFEVVEYEICIY